MKNKGFTLIEILSTLVILAIITVIAVPIIAGVITKVKLGALKSSAYGLMESGDLYYSMYLNQDDIRFNIDDNIMTSNDTDKILDYKGVVKSGMVVLTSAGKIALCISDGTHSVYKNYNDKDVKELSNKVCTIPSNSYVVHIDDEPTLTNLDNSELSDLVDRLNRKIANIETNKADQARFDEVLAMVNNARTLASSSASKEDVELISTIVTGVKQNAINLLSETDNMKTNIDRLKQIVDNAKAKVDASGTAASISNASTDASQASSDATQAKSDASSAKSIATSSRSEISGKTTVSAIKPAAYPVGSIYVSVSSTSPATLFGGTWEKIENRILVGTGSSYSLGSTGGSNAVDLRHSHGYGNLAAAVGSCYGDVYSLCHRHANTYEGDYRDMTYDVFSHSWKTGGKFSHYTRVFGTSSGANIDLSSVDIRQKFVLAYIWRRTA